MKTCIKCGSHAFNLYADGIDQGGFCDVHYWQGRAHRAEAQPAQSSMAYQEGMEAATRAANESWTLVCKKMVELEREACAKLCEKQIEKENLLKTGDIQTLSNLLIGHRVTAHMTDARLIRTRGNT